jgi:hypothetical protein
VADGWLVTVHARGRSRVSIGDGLITSWHEDNTEGEALEAVGPGDSGERRAVTDHLGSARFAPVAAGDLTAHLVERGSRLVLEPGLGGPVAAIDLEPGGRTAAVLESATGRWSITQVEAVGRHRKAHLSVRDAHEAEAATVWLEGRRLRIELGHEGLVLEAPGLLGRAYRIEGLLAARPGLFVGHRLPVYARRPFRVEVLPPLATRRDASFVVPLAVWLAWQHLTGTVP